SAQTNEALRTLAGRYNEFLQGTSNTPLADLCHTANVGRSHLRHRLCVVASAVGELREEFGTYCGGGSLRGGAHGKIDPAHAPRIAFLFTGQGAQYVGMARELFDSEPEFRRNIELCNDLFAAELKRPLLDVLYDKEAGRDLHPTGYTQPALFALEYCLARLWMSWGVVPDLLLGHSLGEYVAA